ncbi:glucose-1-phosphate thymidylyltransferase [soil metagenome]
MKGLILAAGLGTRLRPLSNARPKPVIAVANRPLIVHALDHLVAAGIGEVGIVVSSTTVAEIQRTLAAYRGARISYISQVRPAGLAHAVKAARAFLGDEPFVTYLGDNLFQHGVGAFVDAFWQGNGEVHTVLALARVADPRQFGVAVVEDGRVTRLVEKPVHPPSDLAVAGVYVFDACVHAVIDELAVSARGEYEITDAISGLIRAGKRVAPVEVTGWWKDTGRPEDVLEANRLLLAALEPRQEGRLEGSEVRGAVAVEAGALVRNSLIEGPTIIGAGARVLDAHIGPYTSIGAGVRVRRAVIADSVIEEASVIEVICAPIRSSLIGARVEIRGAGGDAHRLVLGDRSRLELLE